MSLGNYKITNIPQMNKRLSGVSHKLMSFVNQDSQENNISISKLEDLRNNILSRNEESKKKIWDDSSFNKESIKYKDISNEFSIRS